MGVSRSQSKSKLKAAESLEESSLPMPDENEGSTEHMEPLAPGDSASNTGPQPETSTGGFDTMLGKLVIDAGLVTSEEIEQCMTILSSAAETEEPATLADLMIDNEYLTHRQLDRLRSTFEAKKSSQRIPGYRILKKLGAGAMATVFLARQLSLDRLVAIKVLPKKFSDNVKFIERFYKEGQAAAKLNHPNIVQAYDVGKAGDHHYFVMEYVDGKTVYDELVEKKKMNDAEAIAIIRQVAKALKHAHAKGFIHRDIKPKNIMIGSDGVVKLADLGLARAVTDQEAARAEAGRAYGTPYYISPEQIRGEIKIGPQADIYGLGGTFYHMVTGRVPFEGKNPSAVMHKHLKEELEPPDHRNPAISSGCALVIEKMMAKDPRDRYANADDLLEDLELVASGKQPHFARASAMDISALAPSEPIQPVAPAMATPTAPAGSKNPIFMTVAVLAGLSILLNLVLLIALVA